MEFEKVHQLKSDMQGGLHRRGGINWSGGNGTGRRICFSTPTASAGAILGVGIEVMVESEKQGLRVACEEKIEEHHGRYHSNEEGGEREIIAELQIAVDGDSEKTSETIIDRPDGEEKVSGLALVGISTAGTAIERGEVVAQAADAE
jgi:hypothetical protein